MSTRLEVNRLYMTRCLDGLISQLRRKEKTRLGNPVNILTESDIAELVRLAEQPTRSYLVLFNFAEQPKVAQSLLIYACHLHYLFIRLGISEKESANYAYAIRPLAEELYSRVCKYLKFAEPNKKQLAKYIDLVNDKLGEIFVEPFNKNLFYFIGKGN